MLLCNECGNPLTPGLTFCTDCGARVVLVQEAPQVQVYTKTPGVQIQTMPVLPPELIAPIPPSFTGPAQPSNTLVPWLVAACALLVTTVIVVAVMVNRSTPPVATASNANDMRQPGNVPAPPTPEPTPEPAYVPPSAPDPCYAPPPPAFSCSNIARLQLNGNLRERPVRGSTIVAEHFRGAKLCVLDTDSYTDNGDTWYRVRVMQYGAHDGNSNWTGKKLVRSDDKAEKDRAYCVDGDGNAPNEGWVKEIDRQGNRRIVAF